MNQKLQEQAEVYEHMLKTKEEDKMAIAYAKDMIEIQLNRTIDRRDESIRNLTAMLNKNKNEMDKINDRLYVINQEVAEEKQKNKVMEEEMYKTENYVKWLKEKVEELEKQLKIEADRINNMFIEHEK